MMPLSEPSAVPARATSAPAADCLRVLNDDVFRTAVERERKRADRFNQKMALVLVSAQPGRGALDWARVANALAIVKRPTDIVGWVAPGSTLGIIVAEISDQSLADALPGRFRQGLEARVGPGDPGRLSIRVRVHPGPWSVVPRDAVRQPVDDHDDRADVATVRRALYQPIKRGCDIVGSLTCLLLLSPVLVAAAALVKLSSKGPVLFRQARVGHKERPFMMFKFRTMRVDSDPALHQSYMASFISGSGSAAAEAGAAPFKLVHDPRVTRVGAMLRQTSIDELPQLWNVLRGEMSLVGPRPPIDYEVQQYETWHRRRVMDVKPGMTGLWQVAGRSCTTFDQMVRLDLRYAKTCSLWTDVKILLATPRAVVSGKGAR